MLSKPLSVIATAAMAFAVLLLIYTDGFFSPLPIVIALQIAAALLMIWARLTLGWRSFHFSANPTEGGLITSGPYRYIRNPIYAAVLLAVWAGVLVHLSVAHVLFGLLATLGAAIRIVSEESFLRVQYPAYDEYARKTRRVIPFIL
jgi:protein-S-isoprenylcysteine O-methyltransferase Ste14